LHRTRAFAHAKLQLQEFSQQFKHDMNPESLLKNQFIFHGFNFFLSLASYRDGRHKSSKFIFNNVAQIYSYFKLTDQVHCTNIMVIKIVQC